VALGLPVAPPLRTHDGVYLVAGEDGSYSLYPYLPGRVYEAHYTESGGVDAAILARAAAYGRGLARLHRGLAALADVWDASVMDLPQQLRGWVRARLDEIASVATCVADVYHGFTGSLFARYCELPHQIIHRDAHPGNLLIKDNEVSGFIDWEISTQGPRLFDLAYCSTSLLSVAQGISARRHAWLSQLTSLVAGYDSVQPLAGVERAMLGQIQMAIQLIFAAYYGGLGMAEQMDANLATLRWLLDNQDAVAEAASGRGGVRDE